MVHVTNCRRHSVLLLKAVVAPACACALRQLDAYLQGVYKAQKTLVFVFTLFFFCFFCSSFPSLMLDKHGKGHFSITKSSVHTGR